MTLLAFIAPETARNILLIVAGIAYLAYHLVRLISSHRSSHTPNPQPSTLNPQPQPSTSTSPTPTPTSSTPLHLYTANSPTPTPTPAPKPPPSPSTSTSSTSTSSPGADLYRRARAMMHQRIPDYRIDGLYLDLLGDSAEQGYAPAMQKLGEYAMRRGTLVEAYYWFWRAKRQGASNLDTMLREIRRDWTLAGTPDENENISPIFDAKAGSIARALLNIDSGRNVHAVREYLNRKHPTFVKNSIRSQIKQRRKAITLDTRKAASERICSALLTRNASCVCTYLATKDEIDLTSLITTLLAKGVHVCAPRWNGTDYELAELNGDSWSERLVKGPHGIAEPSKDAPKVEPGMVDLWLVPGLAFTQAGVRLGYGGGWYDRLLSKATPTARKIGIAYSFQVLASLPDEPHDITMDEIVTDASTPHTNQ